MTLPCGCFVAVARQNLAALALATCWEGEALQCGCATHTHACAQELASQAQQRMEQLSAQTARAQSELEDLKAAALKCAMCCAC